MRGGLPFTEDASAAKFANGETWASAGVGEMKGDGVLSVQEWKSFVRINETVWPPVRM